MVINKVSEMMNQLRPALLACVALAFAFLSSDVSGQQWARNMFNDFDHDFGIVAKGQKPIYKFKITNNNVETIQILGVTSSCGCTIASLSDTVLESEETIDLICQFNSDVGPGFKQATVTVRFAQPFAAEVQVTVSGTIRNDFMMEPSQLDMGVFSPGGSPTVTSNISRFNNPNWKITDVRSEYTDFDVSVNEVYRGRDKVTYQLTVKVKESATPGRIQNDLLVYVSDDNGRTTSQMRLPVTGRINSTLTINPEILTFADLKVGEEVSRKVILKADKEFRLVDVTCEDQDFVVRADGKSKKVHIVEVGYTGKELGNVEVDLTFITDLNQQTSGKLRAVAGVTSEAEAEGN